MIRAVWQSFWGELNTPSSFRDDPYGALLNQVGHMFGGALTVVFICYAWGLIFREMPPRFGLLLFVPLGYLVVIESLVQGWSKADSFVDAAFVALGAAIPVAGLKEVAFHPSVRLEPQPGPGLAVLAAIAFALAAYVYPRARRKWRADESKGRIG